MRNPQFEWICISITSIFFIGWYIGVQFEWVMAGILAAYFQSCYVEVQVIVVYFILLASAVPLRFFMQFLFVTGNSVSELLHLFKILDEGYWWAMIIFLSGLGYKHSQWEMTSCHLLGIGLVAMASPMTSSN